MTIMARLEPRPIFLIFRLTLRAALGAMFVYAAYTKLRQSWLLFALSIDSYHLLPEWSVLVVARTLPWLEVVLGMLLLAGWKLRYASIAAASLLALFFSVMVIQYTRGSGIDCGCFGVGEALSGRTLARDGFLLAAAFALVVMAWRVPDSRLRTPDVKPGV